MHCLTLLFFHHSVDTLLQDRLRCGCYSALNDTEIPRTTYHIKHCLEYIRQSILCHSNTDSEYREEDEEMGEVGTSGYGTHQCQNFAELYALQRSGKSGKGGAAQSKKGSRRRRIFLVVLSVMATRPRVGIWCLYNENPTAEVARGIKC